jgi:hypothetical protein
MTDARSASRLTPAVVTGLVAVLALAAAAGLLAWRRHDRRQSGGLSVTFLAGSPSTPGARVLGRRTVPTADLDADLGPRPPAGTRGLTYEGWIYLPYRGYFVLALEVRGRADLRVGDAQPIRGQSGNATTEHGHPIHPRRLIKEQRLLDGGWHPLRLTVDLPPEKGSVRLFWQPPGKRGVPEYVEPAMVRPAGPRPGAAGTPGIPRRDAVVALGLVGLALLVLAVALRSGLRDAWGAITAPGPGRWHLAAGLGLLGVALVARLWEPGAAGQTWDEDVYVGAGRNFWLNLLALDLRPTAWQWNLEHPPVTKYLVGLGALFGEGIAPARASSILLGALAAPLGYLLALALRYDARVGLAAGLATAFTPALLGHAQVAGHESASVFLFGLGALLMVRGLDVARTRPGHLLAAGVVLGLAAGCRLVNLTLGIFMAGYAAAVLLRRRRAEPESRLPAALLALPLVALATFVITWPRLLSQPARHLGELLTYWHPDVSMSEYFLGRKISNHPGYFPVYLVVTTPLAVLAGVLAWLVGMIRRRAPGDLALGLLLVAPLAAGLLVPFARDGIRYVLPVTLALNLAAAAGLVALLDLASARLAAPSARRIVTGALAGLVLLLGTAIPAAQVHPYYLDFYNALSGGPEAALKRRWYEFSWWGEGLGPAARWIDRHAPARAVVGMDVPARHTVVLRTDLRTTVPGTQPPPDLLVYAGDGLRDLWDARRRAWRHPAGYRVVHEERVEGQPLVRVYRRR